MLSRLRRYCPRFGLKTALALVCGASLLALPIGLRFQQCAQRRAAIDALMQSGATVFREDEEDVFGIAPLADSASCDAKVIEIEYPKGFTDKELQYLRFFPDIEMLVLKSNLVTTRGLKNLQFIHNLDYIALLGPEFGSPFLEHISKNRELTGINLNFTLVNDSDLAHLKHLTKLSSFDAVGTPLTGQGFASLAHLPLAKLSLQRSQFSDRGAQCVAAIRTLEILYLNNTRITDAGLRDLAKLPNLKNLSLDGCKISDQGLRYLVAAKKLEELSIVGPRLTLAGLESLADLPDLKSIALLDSTLTPRERNDFALRTGIEVIALNAQFSEGLNEIRAN